MYEPEQRRSKAEEQAYARLLEDLERQQRDISAIMRHKSIVPEGWERLDRRRAVEPAKEKVTLRLDADMLAWFRGLGRGHQTRMNAVLRAYMDGVIARALAHRGDKDVHGRPL